MIAINAATKKQIIIVALISIIATIIISILTVPNMVETLNAARQIGALSATQIASVKAIITSFGKYGDGDLRKLAYIIGLAYHESRLQPIKEIKAKPGTYVWDNYQYRYWPSGYYGRGFVQITWKENYRKMGERLGIDLVNKPDLALKTSVAADILVVGMMEGMFTGKKLGDYINENGADYYNARRTVGAINVAGTDTAALIVGHTQKVLGGLS